jgi:hypothetical protein
MKRDIAKRFCVLYTISHFRSIANLAWRRKNLRLGEAPSFTAAHTHSFSDISKVETTFQKMGINWNDVTFPVKKYAMTCFKSVHIPLTRNAKASRYLLLEGWQNWSSDPQDQ